MAAEKNTVRTTVTLESDLKTWLDQGAAKHRREFSAHLNAVLETARLNEGGTQVFQADAGGVARRIK